MSTQNRNTGGGGGRSHKKSNTVSGGGGGVGGGGDISVQVAAKKTDATKTEKEKVPPKPTAEQLRIAQITNSNTIEDPQMREKVATLIETTQRSEEEVCCALYECDYNLERAVVFLLETLPVGAFETSSKKKKNKVAATGTPDGGAGDGEWTTDTNANTDKREKSRNRSSNRGGRGGTDSRGWRGREARENDRNARESRGGDRGERGGERDRDRDERNEAYRSGPRGGGRRDGGGGRGGYGGRGGRGGGGGGSRMSGGRGPGGAGRSGGSYSSRLNANDEPQEVELWDNTIAQNAEKQSQSQDDTWGDWDNEEYVGSLKEGKVFTSSNLPNQTVASVVSGGIGGGNAAERAAPPGLEQHLGSVGLAGSGGSGSGQQPLSSLVSGLTDEPVATVTATTPMQYSAAVTSSQVPPQQQPAPSAGQQSTVVQQPAVASTQPPQQSPVAHSLTGSAAYTSGGGAAVDAFASAATAAANLVQQAQQQQPQVKSSATLSAEQSQYFNSLSSQNTGVGGTAPVAGSSVQQLASYAQQPTGASVQYPNTYANVFGSGVTNAAGAASNGATDAIQMPAGGPQPRRARAKLPPPSKIPSSAVEMPGDSLNNIGYLDVQFGALDFGPDDSFDSISDKFNSAVTVDTQVQQPQTAAPQQQDVATEFQSKSAGGVQQQPPQQQVSLAATLQNSQLGDSLTSAYSQRSSQQQVVGGGATSSGSSTLDQLAKAADQYNQSGAANASSYQNAYQVTGAKSTNAYQQQAPPVQGYTTSYANVQSSVANAYQGQTYGSYQQNSVNSYQQQQQQQQQQTGVVGGTGATGGGVANSVSSSSGGGVSSSSSSATVNSTQNIPGGSNSSTASNPSSAYLSSGYTSQPSAYQSTQSVYHSSSLNSTGGFTGSTNTSSSQYSNFSASAKLKENATTSSNSHFDNSVTANTSAGSSSGPSVSSVTSVAANAASSTNANNSGGASVVNSVANSTNSSNSSSNATGNNNTNATSAVSGGSSGAAVGVSTGSGNVSGNASSVATAATAGGSSSVSSGSSSNKNSAGGMVPNIQMVSQYIQTGLPYYQQPVYSYEEIQMMQQRVPHVQGYYDLNYTNTSLGAGRDNLGSVAYSAMADGRFTRTDNNSSPVGNVSSTMSQQAGSGGPMLNVPYYFYSGNVMPGSFQYGTPAIYPPQIPAANSASGGQFPKPSYNTGYNSTSYDALSQATQEYSKGAYQSSVTQQAKSQNSTNAPQTGSGSDITSSMYGKGHVALNKVNSYEKQSFHSGTPPPFNMANTQTAGGTSAQPYGMYLPMPAGGHHNMIHQPIHQDSNSTGQRQQTTSQSKSGTKQGYSPSYWTGQN